MTGISDPIRLVTIPEWFSVSHIVTADDCLLKFLMTLQKDTIVPLRPSPSAELGRVFHSLLEEAVKGFSGGEEVSIKNLETVLDRLLRKAEQRLKRSKYTAPYANLPQTMTPLAWERKRRSFVDAAFEFVDRTRKGRQIYCIERHGGFDFKNLCGDGRWAEVPIHVPVLRLKARMDMLERTGNDIKITDLKSGRCQNSSGKIEPRISLQLRLYGIMVQTLYPQAQVTLVVNDGEEHSIPYDSAIASETKEWLRSLIGGLEPGSIVSKRNHAKVGPSCRWCGFRHRCDDYLYKAPSLWNREVKWHLPLDSWGTVEGIEPYDHELLNLTLLDDGNRRVKIFRVRKFHLESLRTLDRLYFFNLAASLSAMSGYMWRHPLNFYEISDSNAAYRAWSLEVFNSKNS